MGGKGNRAECKYLANLGKEHVRFLCTIFVHFKFEITSKFKNYKIIINYNLILKFPKLMCYPMPYNSKWVER